MFSIDSIMSTNLITIAPTSSLAEARSLMQEHRIHHLPVTDSDNILIGLMTLTDLLSATDSRLRNDDSRIHAADVCIREVMATDIATVDHRATPRQAALFLEKHKIGCLPVVNDGKLCGIITDTDFLAIAINLLEQLEESEPLDDDLNAAGVA